MADVVLGVQIDEALFAGREPAVVREVDRAGVDHGPFQKAACRQLLDRPKARCRRHRPGRVRAAGERQGRVDDHVLLLADALDDPPVGLGLVALPAGRRVVGVDVDDRRPLLGAGDALGDDLLDRDRDLRLQLPPPRPVQRHFQPDAPLRHDFLPWSGRSSGSQGLFDRLQWQDQGIGRRPAAAARRSGGTNAAALASLASIARAITPACSAIASARSPADSSS